MNATTRFAIYSPNEAAIQDGAGYWNSNMGWGDEIAATLFTKEETEVLGLPLSTGKDARWVPAEDRCPLPRLFADFQPQQWYGPKEDVCIPVGESFKIDVTSQVLALTPEDLSNFAGDDSIDADNIVQGLHDHTGPFYVTIMEEMDRFFELHGTDRKNLTDDHLSALREKYADEANDDEWDGIYRCPKCENTEGLSVVVSAWAKLTQDGPDNFQTDADADGVPDHDHEWDEFSAARCSCGWRGKVVSLKVNAKIPPFKVGSRVYWTDPDNGVSSGPGTIFRIQGDGEYPIEADTIISLSMADGGEAEVLPHEIRLLSDVLSVEPAVKILRIVVAATNANGEPDFFFLKVKCTPNQYDNGDHYEAALDKAEEEDYEGPFVVFDENDSAGKAIMSHFAWQSAEVVDISNL